MRPRVRERDLGRLLHHVAELAGQREPRLALHRGRLDEEDVATGAGDRQPGGHTGHRRAVGSLEEELRTSEVWAHVVGVDDDRGLGFARGQLGRHLAQHLAQLALEIPHTSLTRVVGDDRPQGGVGHLDLGSVEAIAVELAREEVVARDGDLLVLGVAVEPDDLQPVEQRPGDGVEHVGRGEEQHVRQVEVDLQVVVAERVVLRGVEDLEQRGRRVAPPVGADLVDLVQHHHRVLRPGVLQRPHDPPRQRADVGPAVPADLGLVVDAAQGDSNELPPQGPSNALTQRRLAHPRRPDQGQDRTTSAPVNRTQPPLLTKLSLAGTEHQVVRSKQALPDPSWRGRLEQWMRWKHR